MLVQELAFEFLESMAPEENKFFEYWLRPYYQKGVNIQINDLIAEYKTQMKSIADYLAEEDYMVLNRGKGVFVVSKIIIKDEEKFGNTLVDCLFDSLEHRKR